MCLIDWSYKSLWVGGKRSLTTWAWLGKVKRPLIFAAWSRNSDNESKRHHKYDCLASGKTEGNQFEPHSCNEKMQFVCERAYLP